MSLAATELPSGFWSYVHRDNAAEGDRLLRLCEFIKEEFALLTGRDLELFVDRTGLAWGDKWRATIDNALTETTFFIAIVTPRYLASVECRKELLVFSQNAKARDVAELLFPILYIDVDGLQEDSPDEVKAAIAQAQYEPFTELRLLEEDSSEYRTAVNRMARRLVDIANTVAGRADERLDLVPTASSYQPEDDDAPGLIEAMNAVEGLLPQWLETINAFQGLLERIGEVTTQHTPKMQEASAKGTAAAIVQADRYAKEIQPVAQEFKDVGIQYVDQALQMSQSMVTILDYFSTQPDDVPVAEDAEYFLRSVLKMVEAGQSTAPIVEEFQASVRSTAGMSRAVRKPLKLISDGAQQFLDGQALLNDWKRRIEEILNEDEEK
ncbi:TIR domain-containing protein [Mycolicibacterium nivoides]|nr:toll/interleukin-1 receptor domain-containing protein [Mycolicibacterium septicum]